MLDVALPDLDGIEVLRQLKVSRVTKKIPVILKTAILFDDAHRERGLAAGAVEYFINAHDPDALAAVVRRVLADVERTAA